MLAEFSVGYAVGIFLWFLYYIFFKPPKCVNEFNRLKKEAEQQFITEDKKYKEAYRQSLLKQKIK